MKSGYSLFVSILFFIGITSVSAQQNHIFTTQNTSFNLTESQENQISEYLRNYEIFEADGSEFKAMMEEDNVINTDILLPYVGLQPIFLERSEVISSKSVLQSTSGTEVPMKERAIALKGNIGFNGDDIRLTVNDGFIKGIYFLDGKTYHIQPLNDYIDTDEEFYITFEISDGIAPKNVSCGIDNMKMWAENYKHSHNEEEPEIQEQVQVVDCYTVEMGVAADYSFFTGNGNNLVAVENELIARMNNSQTNYDNEFEDALIFEIVTTFIVDQSGQDPWTSSTDSEALLNSFRTWANGGGFGTTSYDDAGLWSGRNFDGSTIGLAWLNSVCYSFRYHVLQDFSNNAELLRVLWSHEMGHNWSLDHDASGSNYIMAPAVSGATSWSSASIISMDNKVDAVDPQSGGCLSYCPPANPIVADFTSDIQNLCVGSTVQFYDLSSNEPDTWNWTFTGGIPATSSDQSPLVRYDVPGTYQVILQASNSNSSDTKTKNGFITVGTSGESHVIFEEWENGLGNWVPSGNNGIAWTTTATNLGSGDYSLFMNNYNNSVGDIDELVSPGFTTAGYQSLRVEIMYAYTNKNNEHDSLSLQISTNGGQTWSYVDGIAESGSNNFRTAPRQTTSFSISDREEWCYDQSNGYAQCLSWDISSYVGNYDVKMRLRSVSDNGNNLYIDHLAVIGDCYDLPSPVADFEADITEGCAPLEVQFTDLSTNLPESWDWTFVGGTPSTSTEQNPVVTYDQPGSYDVILEVTNPSGTSVELKQSYITALPGPVASFTHVVNGLTVDFTNTSFGATSYSWNFGDGNTSSVENPSHTYATGGDYNVTLTIVGDCGTDDVTEEVSLSVMPVAEFSYSPSSGCSPLTVQYEDESTAATSWSWVFPGGNPSTSTLENPVVIYNTPGIYDATLTVTNATGSDVITKTSIIEVTADPTASFSYTRTGFTVDFDATSQNVNSYNWDFGDGGSSTNEDPSHTYVTVGTYNVVLKAYGDCDTLTITEEVEIIATPVPDFSATMTEACVPTTIQFSDQSTGGATSWLWEFEGGNPSTSTLQNPVVTYNNVGTFDVTLTATNSEGSETILKTDYITINDVPVASFTISQNGLNVSLNNLSQGANSYLWNFGDGNTSTDVNPSHTYISNGNYDITLEATNDCGTTTLTKSVTVGIPPVANFDGSSLTGCLPYTKTFFSTSVGADSYFWIFEGGNPGTSTAANPTISYNIAGVYDVTLIVSNQFGSDTLVRNDHVTINDKPEVDIDLVVAGLNLSTINNTTNADNYTWNFGDGNTSNLVEPTHTYASEGTFTVTLIATNECGSSTITKSINVGDFPNASFTVENREGCVPHVVDFQDLSSNADSYEWTFEGGSPATSVEAEPVITYNSAGTYDVTLIVENALGKDTLFKEDYITVGDVPVADFSFSTTGNEVAFMNESSGEIDSYNWFFGDGQTSTLENPTNIYGEGEFNAMLIVSNQCGSDTIVKTVIINATLVAKFSTVTNIVCAGNSISFTDESEGNPSTYNWTFEGGTPSTSTERNPTVTYNVPGKYSVGLVIANGANTDEITRVDYISVIDVPVADFEAIIDGRNVEFDNNSLYGTEFMWFFGNGESNNQTNPEIEYPNVTEVYEVTLIASNMCGIDTIVKTIEILSETATYEAIKEFQIFPNPFRNEVYITTLSDIVINRIELYSIDGRQIQLPEAQIVHNDEYVLNTSKLVDGAYFIKLYSDNNVYVARLIKQ